MMAFMRPDLKRQLENVNIFRSQGRDKVSKRRNMENDKLLRKQGIKPQPMKKQGMKPKGMKKHDGMKVSAGAELSTNGLRINGDISRVPQAKRRLRRRSGY